MPAKLSLPKSRRTSTSEEKLKLLENSADYLRESGLAWYCNVSIFHPLGTPVRFSSLPDGSIRMEILDAREKPSTTFDSQTFADGESRWRRFSTRAKEIAAKRRSILGYLIQRGA
jgi:hypothetical protein